MDDDSLQAAASFFSGEGEMVRAVHAKDWSATLLGPVERWPASIRTAVSISLNSDFQISVLSGPDLVYIYNDATIPIFGAKHPWALGRRVAEVWPEAWSTIGPMLTSVLATGKAIRHDDLLLVLDRAGFVEECYFTFSYSPIRADPHAPDGVFVTTMETTRRVLSERRQRTLNELATQLALRRGDERTLDLVRQTLAANVYDVPLSALYLAEAGAGHAEQVFCTGLHQVCAGIAKRIPWSCTGGGPGEHPLARLAQSIEPHMYDASVLLGEADSCGVWPEAPHRILALPLVAPGHAMPRGFLLVALNPRAPLDADYRQFIDTVAGLVATAVAGIDAIAADVFANDITERKRVEAERRAAQAELNVLYDRLQTVREAERTALAREVHDQLGQTLSAAKIDLRLLEDDIDLQGAALAPEKIIHELQSACATLDGAMQLVREIATELRAPELDGQGLYAAMEWHARDFERRTRIKVQLEIGAGMAQPARPAAEALLKIFREAMTNVLRHAHAVRVCVSVERRGGALLLRVRDDGTGIARQRPRTVRSLGITGMRERAALAGGRLTVGPLAPRGTLVSALVPMGCTPQAPSRAARAGGTKGRKK